jgi:hypothetical protein
MARLRLLFALFLIAVGTTFAALALSGYYEPRMPHGQPAATSMGWAVSTEAPPVIAPHFRQRFLATNEGSAAGPAKPKATKSAPKSPPKPKPSARSKPPQHTAVQWPWSLFSN